ncbi:MAG TPA: transglycosylase domain-containing protein [Aeromicrobium sp.]|nr:transglycosylase domain-containing protein [Aeromicrobium sp.]
MPREVDADSSRRTGRISAVFGLLRLSVVAGLIVAAMIVPATAFAGITMSRLTQKIVDLPAELPDDPAAQTTRVRSSDHKLMAYFYRENRKDVPLEKISPTMQQAILAIEDNRFYRHGALDLQGTIRALVNNATRGTTQGGSSITQQLVKLTLVQQARTQEEIEAATATSVARKIRELKLAVQYEKTHSKDEILERYLNIAYYGDGAYGIDAAARHWFSTSAGALTTNQAALLAGVVKNPSYYDPKRSPERATQRRNTVLAVMAEQGKISPAEAQRLMAEPLGLKITAFAAGCASAANNAAFACDYIRRYLLQEPALGQTVAERAAVLERGGLTIESTIDPSMQRAIHAAVTSTVAPTDRAIGAQALVEPGTGKVRGIAQSRPMGRDLDAGESYINFAVPTGYGDSAGFQAGSTFKLFTTAAALKKGIKVDKTYNAPKRLTIPGRTFRTCTGGVVLDPWPVANSTVSGKMNMYNGLRKSVNTYYAQLERDTGLCNVVQTAQSMGIVVPDRDQVGPFTLGVTDVSPLTMAAAYAVPASGGIYCKPQPVEQILDMKGQVIKTYTRQCRRVLPPKIAAQINDILEGLQRPGGFGYANGTGLSIPSAAKTGTTNSNRAVWYVGYTPRLAAASMIAGADDQGRPRSLAGVTLRGSPISFSQVGGSSLAGPMWKKAMGIIQAQLPPADFAPPPEDEPKDDDSIDPDASATPEPPDQPFDPFG